MKRLVKSKVVLGTVVFLLAIGLNAGAIAADAGAGRVMPLGKISIFDGQDKIGELSSEAPLPTDRILVSDQRFAVKMPGIYMVAEKNAKLSVRPFADGRDIFLQAGKVYFAMGAVQGILTLSTPQESVTVERVVITASTATPMVKGFVSYMDEQMEIGVTDGGKLMITNAKGQRVIDAGNGLKVYRTQADLGNPEEGEDKVIGNMVPLGVGAGTLVAGVIALSGGSGGSGGGPGPASPFEP